MNLKSWKFKTRPIFTYSMVLLESVNFNGFCATNFTLDEVIQQIDKLVPVLPSLCTLLILNKYA